MFHISRWKRSHDSVDHHFVGSRALSSSGGALAWRMPTPPGESQLIAECNQV